MSNKKPWVKTVWPYSMDSNPVVAYRKKLSGSSASAIVYIRDDENFHYSVSDRKDGNGDYSFSGSFCRLDVKNIEEAMKVLDINIPSYLSVPRHWEPYKDMGCKSLEECLNEVRGIIVKKETDEEKNIRETAIAVWKHMGSIDEK